MKGSAGSERAAGSGGEVVVALFESQADAEQAIQDLKEGGFPTEAIGVVLRDPAYRRGPLQPDDITPLPGDAGPAGALGSGILGGVVGLLTGAGALALPGVGPVIAGGVLVTSLTAAKLGAATGGMLGALIGLGIPEGVARYFEVGVRQGSVLVTVDAGGRSEAARDILGFFGGDLGAGLSAEEVEAGDEDEAWRGSERRYRDDPAYAGPERRLSAR